MNSEAHVPVADYAVAHPVLQLPGETRMLDHLPQLDGVRAIAVLTVLWFHFQPAVVRVNNGPPWGAFGVGLFFTLSGFLITRILLNCKDKIVEQRATFWSSFKQFYVRRFLRIFPLYYGVLIVMFAFNISGFRRRALWNFLYLTNVYYAFTNTNLPGADSGFERHLWSLSVEEQFYIVWPLLILLTPRKLLVPLLMLTIATGPIWRYYTYRPKYLIHEWMTPGCLDLLAMGALLALLSLPKFKLTWWRDGFVQICGLIGVPMVIAFIAQRWYPTVKAADGRMIADGYNWIYYGGATNPITAVASVWLIGTAAKGFRGPVGWFLTSAPVVYTGRISYGLYVLHMFVPHFLYWLWPHYFPANNNRLWWQTIVFTVISFAAASLSWFLYEAPINRLKRYFEYDATAAARLRTSAVVDSSVGVSPS